MAIMKGFLQCHGWALLNVSLNLNWPGDGAQAVALTARRSSGRAGMADPTITVISGAAWQSR